MKDTGSRALTTFFMLVYYLAHLSTLKMEAICYSETWVYFYPTAWRCIPEVRILHSHRYENLKSSCVEELTTNTAVQPTFFGNMILKLLLQCSPNVCRGSYMCHEMSRNVQRGLLVYFLFYRWDISYAIMYKLPLSIPPQILLYLKGLISIFLSLKVSMGRPPDPDLTCGVLHIPQTHPPNYALNFKTVTKL
jgi:hypothetical protein